VARLVSLGSFPGPIAHYSSRSSLGAESQMSVSDSNLILAIFMDDACGVRESVIRVSPRWGSHRFFSLPRPYGLGYTIPRLQRWHIGTPTLSYAS